MHLYCLVWTIWLNWWAFDFISYPSFLWNNKVKISFLCRSSAKKEFKRLYCHLLQCLFFWVFTLSQTLWYDAQFPRLMVILFSDLNSCQFSYQTSTDAKMDTCVSGCPVNSLSFVQLARHHLSSGKQQKCICSSDEHGNRLCWRCFACILMSCWSASFLIVCLLWNTFSVPK